MTFFETLPALVGFLVLGFLLECGCSFGEAFIGILRKKFPKFNSLFFRHRKN